TLTAGRYVPRSGVCRGYLPAPKHDRRLTLLRADLNQQALPQIPCSHANRVEKINQGSSLTDGRQQERHILIRRSRQFQRLILRRGNGILTLVRLVPQVRHLPLGSPLKRN